MHGTRRWLVGLAVLAMAAAIAPPATATGATHGGVRVCGGPLVALRCGVAERGPSGSRPLGWGPEDLRAAYHLGPRSPRHGTIAVLDVGPYPTLSEDLATYRGRYGLSACTSANGCLRQLDYRGGPALPPPVTAAEKAVAQLSAVETAADVDMASAICPSCRLLEIQIPPGLAPKAPHRASDYEGYAAAFGTAVRTAIAHGADTVSISFTIPGDAAMLHGPIARALDHPGVPIVAGSGDYGFNGDGNSLLAQPALADFQGSAYTWPQALPTVTSVGGTTMIKQGKRYAQGVWPQAGSGCTPGVRPAGQPPAVSRLCGGGRAGSDVSAVADNLAMYDSYRPADHAEVGWIVLSGTSLSTPQIAALYAAGGHRRAVHGPDTLYRAPAGAFSDVTSGTNAQLTGADGGCVAAWQIAHDESPTSFPRGLCVARPGWDGPTGRGVPRGYTAF